MLAHSLPFPIISTSRFLPRNKQISSQSHFPLEVFWHSQTPRFCLSFMSIILFNKVVLSVILFRIFIVCTYAFQCITKIWLLPGALELKYLKEHIWLLISTNLQTIGEDKHYISNNDNIYTWVLMEIWEYITGVKPRTGVKEGFSVKVMFKLKP